MRSLALLASVLSAMALSTRAAYAERLDLGEIEDVEVLSLSELLEQPTEAASRYARKPADSPSVVSTVDAEMIEKLGYRSLSEALQNVRGVHVSNDRNYSYLGVRGFSVPGDFNSRIALSIDGHRLNDPVYGQASTGAELGLPMIAVERIELLRGGAWSVYGQNALLAAIHVVTATGASRPGLRITSTTRATAESHSDPAARPAIGWRGEDVSASYGAVVRGLDLFVAGNYQYDPGLPRLYTPGLDGLDETCVGRDGRQRACDGIIEGYDREAARSLFAAIRGKRLALTLLAAHRNKVVPTASYDTIIGDYVETIDRRMYADLTYKVESRRADLIAHLSADHYSYWGRYPYLGQGEDALSTLEASYPNLDESDGTMFSGELRGRYKHARLGRYLRDLEVAGGLELGAMQSRQYNYNRTSAGDETLVDAPDETRGLALAAHVTGRAFDHLVAFVAGRADFSSGTAGTQVQPQAGLVLDGEELGRIRVSLGRGYRAPNAYERLFGANTQVVNPLLRPERSETRELSGEHFLDKNVRVLAVLFSQSIEDLIAFTSRPDGIRVFDNVEQVYARGVEAAVDARWTRFRLHAHLSRQRVVDHTGRLRVNAPKTLGGVTLILPFAGERGDLGIEASLVGERKLLDGTMLPPQTKVSLAATLRRVAGPLDLSLGVTNLLDQRHMSPGSEEHRQSAIPSEPRTVWLRLSLGVGGEP